MVHGSVTAVTRLEGETERDGQVDSRTAIHAHFEQDSTSAPPDGATGTEKNVIPTAGPAAIVKWRPHWAELLLGKSKLLRINTVDTCRYITPVLEVGWH